MFIPEADVRTALLTLQWLSNLNKNHLHSAPGSLTDAYLRQDRSLTHICVSE
ncbi:hypothetical protein H5T17_24260 [Escherichia coli]|nr:hypothetical protein [Escherichia coli]